MNTIKKINEFQKFGSKLGLNRMNRLMDLLGNPQEGLKFIHIGGTNGKGSVSSYIYSVLKENGYRTGMFTSPFMDGFRNAIVVDDEPMSQSELDNNYKKIEHAIAKMMEEGFESPTEFEVITALTFLYFKKEEPDFVILEVGLGGIGDSTNIIKNPVASVITSVSLDHCDVLGNTIEEIAHEKAGIIKTGSPVISNVSGSAARVIAREAYSKKSPLIDVSKLQPAVKSIDKSGSVFSLKIDGINYPEMRISMAGNHQIRNAVCALSVIELMRKKALISLDSDKTRNGLESAGLEGRFEQLDTIPQIIMDGAHNQQGAEALADNMKSFYKDRKVLTIFSLMKDKHIDGVIREFVKFSNDFIIADILDDKPVDVKNIYDTAAEYTDMANIKTVSRKQELLELIKNTSDYDVILITGSLYLIRDLRQDLINIL